VDSSSGRGAVRSTELEPGPRDKSVRAEHAGVGVHGTEIRPGDKPALAAAARRDARPRDKARR
jgi:hypothetical protein